MNILAIDVGGTFIKYGIYDRNAQTLCSVNQIKTPKAGLDDFVQTIKKLREEAGDISGVAMSLPGTIDSDTGFVYQGGNLSYNDKQNLAEILKETLLCPVTLENDARCAALAELWKGSLVGVQNALVLVIGTGLGGAVIQNGRLYKGSHLYAGELSYLSTKGIDSYGMDTTLGAQISIPYFVDKCSEKLGRQLEGPELFSILEKGCPKLQQDFDEYLRNFAQQIFNFQFAFDPEKIVFGGGISKNEFFLNSLKQYVEAFYQKLPFPLEHSLGVCRFGNSANLLGAVKHYLEKEELDA
ncbi:MAG: ROK family protein [Lachnospiraceae bacterium]|nr:ROK family protein [Lachnospiraceae bacterium]